VNILNFKNLSALNRFSIDRRLQMNEVEALGICGMIMTGVKGNIMKEICLSVTLCTTNPTWEPKRTEENVFGEQYIKRGCVCGLYS
jgi:hypothetical protein